MSFRFQPYVRALLVLSIAPLATGCEAIQALRTPPVDKASPLAASAKAASKQKKGDIPRLQDVPPRPTDMPSLPTIAAKVEHLNAAGDQVRQHPRAVPTDQQDAESFATDARTRAQNGAPVTGADDRNTQN